MAFERIAERKIREAMQAGEFDNLPHGKRIDLDANEATRIVGGDYFKLPADLRMAYSIVKSAGCLPQEVELLREADRLQTELDAAPDEPSRARLRAVIAAVRLELNVALDRRRREERA